MNSNLYGKTILIGRQPSTGKLMISVGGNGGCLANAGQVPASVSRCKPAEGVAHCSIAVDRSGGMTLHNMKPQNITCVDGTAIASKRITQDDKVTLGKDNYPVNIAAILNAATALAPSQQSYSIRHLEKVWDDYQNGLKKIRNFKANNAVFLRISGTFTVLFFVIKLIPDNQGLPSWVSSLIWALIGIFAILTIVGIYLSVKIKNMTTKGMDKLVKDFQKHYVCPKCGSFLNQAYILLKQREDCPYCKCKWTN